MPAQARPEEGRAFTLPRISPLPLLVATVPYSVVLVLFEILPARVIKTWDALMPWVNTTVAMLCGLFMLGVLIVRRQYAFYTWLLWLWAVSLVWVGFWFGRAFIAPTFGFSTLDPTEQSLLLRVAFLLLYVIPSGYAVLAVVKRPKGV